MRENDDEIYEMPYTQNLYNDYDRSKSVMKSNANKYHRKRLVFIIVATVICIGIGFSLLFILKSLKASADILNCNAHNACGLQGDLHAACYKWNNFTSSYILQKTKFKFSKMTLFDYDITKTINYVDDYMSEGYWCMPCCTKLNINPNHLVFDYRMPTCCSCDTYEKSQNHFLVHGRCGIDFNP